MKRSAKVKADSRDNQRDRADAGRGRVLVPPIDSKFPLYSRPARLAHTTEAPGMKCQRRTPNGELGAGYTDHRSYCLDTSDQVWFMNDQLAIRFIEEIDFDYAADDATAVLLTPAVAPG